MKSFNRKPPIPLKHLKKKCLCHLLHTLTILLCPFLVTLYTCTSRIPPKTKGEYNNERSVDLADIPDSLLPVAIFDEARLQSFERDIAKYGLDGIDIRSYLDVLFLYRDVSLVPLYLRILESTLIQPYFKLQAVSVLGEIGTVRTVRRLLEVYECEENEMIREYIACSVGKVADSTYIPPIDRFIKHEKNAYIVKTWEAARRRITRERRAEFGYLPLYDTTHFLRLRVFPGPAVDPEFSHSTGKEIADRSVKLAGVANSCVFPHLQYKRCQSAYDKVKQPFASFGIPGVSHVGEDSGWLFSGLPVHSIMNGVVVFIQHEESWGCLVCIESILPDGQAVCSYYGHLSYTIDVHVGQEVGMGDKIGEIGPAYSFQNGGYRSHLHLGIEKASFENALIVGYNDDVEHWYNPFDFIEERSVLRKQ